MRSAGGAGRPAKRRARGGTTRSAVVLTVLAVVSPLAFVAGPLLMAQAGASYEPPTYPGPRLATAEQGPDPQVRADSAVTPSPTQSPGTAAEDPTAAASPDTDTATSRSRGGTDDTGRDGAGRDTTRRDTTGQDDAGGAEGSAPTAAAPRTRGSRGGSGGGAQEAQAGSAASSQGLQAPATGRYRYAVDGWESTSAPGSRRDFPGTADVVVRDRREGEAGTSVTIDLTYSDSHDEQLVVRYGRQGAEITFEGGEVSFFAGTVTESSAAEYAPPMVRVPAGAAPGDTWSGSAEARDPDDGTVLRRVEYTGRVRGTEQVTVAGRSLSTLVVEWRSEFTGSESGWRRQTLWFSPELGIWVKRHDRMHAERFGFSYDKDATLTLRELP